MEIGITLRNMGPQSSPAVLLACARLAERARLASVWVTDHIAIPPDDAEGSGGRYLDTLVTLGWLAGATERIGLGSGVLVLPYRPPLPTAKAVATVQELSGGRLLLGVGVGWMEAEFRALGVPRSERGRRSDETLAFLDRCFRERVPERHGQAFLFEPKPAKPPILVGGAARHAIPRVLTHGDGWLPMGTDPDKLRSPVAELREKAREAGRPRPQVVAMGGLPMQAPAARERLAALRDAGIDQVVAAARYQSVDDFAALVDYLAGLQE